MTFDRDMALMFAVILFAAAAVVFLILWLIALAGRRRQRRLRSVAEDEHYDLRLSLDEQTARLRIIRELHELAIHSVSTMIRQADGAKYAGANDPAASLRALDAISDAAAATLADLRRVMTVVREGEADVAPQPKQRSARDLFKVMREAGLIIDFEEQGDRFDLRQGAELAIYRILQESLSNALKHGGDGTRARVSFSWSEEGFQLRVEDDGVRARDRRAGRDPNEVAQQRRYDIQEDLTALTDPAYGAGITEMRERAALFGGVFTAGPVPGVGFSVSVVFPALRYHNGVHGVNLADGD